MIQNSQHRLVFGALELMGRTGTAPSRYVTRAAGTSWGNPVPIEKVITSFLQDGSIAAITGFDNREMTIMLMIKGEDSYALAAAEEALQLEVGRRNTLTWYPPNKIVGFGEPCVFDVVTSSFDHELDDQDELHLQRKYTLTIKALPFARSQDVVKVVSPAPPSTSPSVTLVDACSATTGWAGSPNAVSTSGGSVRASATAPAGGNLGVTLTRTGLSANMSATPYLRVDYTWSALGVNSGFGGVTVKINGTTVTPVATNGNVAWYLSPVSTITSFSVSVVRSLNAGGSISLAVADLSRSDIAQDQAGSRQTFRSLDVAGSARTEGSLVLADPTSSLGSVLVFTTPDTDAAQPPLRARLVPGPSETASSLLVSGKSSDLGTIHPFEIPASLVPPGGYLLLARVKHATAGPRAITWAAKSRIGTTDLGAGDAGAIGVTLAADTWTIVEVADIDLPTKLLGPAGKVRIELAGPSGLLLDEAWIFNLDTGQLTWVECGNAAPSPGGAANRMWLDAASIDNPEPMVWVGNSADRSDAFGAGELMRSLGRHQFVPKATNVFTVNTNAVAVEVQLAHYRRYHTHVVKAAS